MPAASLSRWLLRFSSRWWQNLTSFPFPFLGFLSAVLAKGILKEGKRILVFSITYSICRNNIKIMSMKEVILQEQILPWGSAPQTHFLTPHPVQVPSMFTVLPCSLSRRYLPQLVDVYWVFTSELSVPPEPGAP